MKLNRSFYHSYLGCSALIVGVLVFSPAAMAKESASGSADNAAKGALLQSEGNKETGDTLSAVCGSQNRWACPLAALSYAQAAIGVAAFFSDKETQKKFSSGGGTGLGNSDFTEGFDETYSNPDLKKLALDINNGLNDLEKKGIHVDIKKGTITDPTGKTTDLKKLNSLQAMAEAGLIKDSDISQAQKALNDAAKKLKDKYKVISVGIGGGGGGGNYSGARGTATSSSDSDPYAAYMNQGHPQAPKTAGLTRTLASGEVIGAKTDNIFDMIRRSYQRKIKEKSFIGQE